MFWFLLVSHLRNEDIAAMAELPFLKADIREIFESKHNASSALIPGYLLGNQRLNMAMI